MNMRKWWFDKLGMQEFCEEGLLDTRIPPAKELGRITAHELYELTPDTFAREGGDGIVRKSFWDKEYVLTSKEEVERWLALNPIDKLPYIENDFDCNRFAVALWGAAPIWTPGICLGLTIMKRHARNWFVDNNRVIWEIEGMNDNMFELATNIYEFRM